MRRPTLLIAAIAAFVFTAAPTADAAGKKRGGAAKPAPAAPVKRGAPNVKIKPVEEAPTESPAQASGAPPPSRGPTRIDFDDRLIQGQTNKSGAVYLYDRKELKTRSMIKKRESFREEIVGSIYDS
jgi:hypothetical protein